MPSTSDLAIWGGLAISAFAAVLSLLLAWLASGASTEEPALESSSAKSRSIFRSYDLSRAAYYLLLIAWFIAIVVIIVPLLMVSSS